MKIIVGLGNPGEKYKITRHNIGFMFLDFLKNKLKFSEFIFESKFKAEISLGTYNSEKIILVKPQTFMNLSGESIKKVCDYYKIKKEDLIIIYDDLSMEFGKIRFREKGSAGGHNGIKSIIGFFGDEFNRIKIGIGYNQKFEVSDWVLSKFSMEELIDLDNEVYNETYSLIKEKI